MYRSEEERLVYKKLNSAPADSETPRRLPHGTYVLHRPGCAQAEDQLLRERWQWHDSRRRIASRHTHGPGPLDESIAATVECGDGSHDVHRLDLRSSQTTCCCVEGSASPDAAGYCGGEKEKRPHRCQQDLRLPAVRFSAGVLHGL